MLKFNIINQTEQKKSYADTATTLTWSRKWVFVVIRSIVVELRWGGEKYRSSQVPKCASADIDWTNIHTVHAVRLSDTKSMGVTSWCAFLLFLQKKKKKKKKREISYLTFQNRVSETFAFCKADRYQLPFK